MKMVKSLLLGTAAGLVALAGAQAADLPVKAKPVQYVKICSLYGAGFYYIPGTDTCIKIGGYVRVQLEAGAGGGGVPNIMGGVQGAGNRLMNDYGYRMRGNATWDVRSQTQYGTLRSYMSIQVQNTDTFNPDVINTETAFIQFAGFTAGITNSFYDFHSFAAYGYLNYRANSNAGAGGVPLVAYTAQFGNGVSASLALEDTFTRRGLVIDTATAIVGNTAATFGTAPTTDYAGAHFPDVTANLRVDQAWGSAQVMGALHDVSAQYYGANAAMNSAHPDNKWGYALGAGIKLNIPGMPGDVFWLQGNYAEGATSYTFNNAATIWNRFDGGTVGYGWVTDAVFGTAAANPNLDLTASWSVTGTYEHLWSKSLKTSLNAGYQAIEYSANANAMICANATVLGYGLSNCDNDFSAWFVGSRTEWAVVPNLNIGLDVAYTKLNTASAGTSVAVLSTGAGNGTQSIGDVDIWSVAMRLQRNFYP